MEAAKWWSDPKGGGSFKGPNDSGICQFSVKAIRSMVREVIQNSLDAMKIDENKPTIVEFKAFSIPSNQFPSETQFKGIIDKCLNSDESNRQDHDIQSIFNNALNAMKDNISVLRISDFNTSGLEGSDTGKKGSSWSRLTMDSGSANSNSGAQGSYGIGKSAPFACSSLRTVFYSSLDRFGKKSTIGVARLVSYKENASEDSWTTGELHWTHKQGIAIPELATIDKDFDRKETGTDIYIMGMYQEKHLEKKIILAVVMNFLVSIWNGKLKVIINDNNITKDNLGEIIDSFFGEEYSDIITSKTVNEDIVNLQHYYNLLTLSNEKCHKIPIKASDYGKAYGFMDDEAILYLLEGDDLNRRILMTRKAGMKLFEQGNISGSISFTGILIITGENMNREFRKIELSSHDNWDSEACKDRTQISKLNNMYKDLRACLRNLVRQHMVDTNVDLVDAFGVNEFLPSDTTNNMNGAILKEKIIGIPTVKAEKDISPTERKSRKRDEGTEPGLVANKKNNRKPKVIPPNPDPNPNPPAPQPQPKPINPDRLEKSFKTSATSVKQSLLCVDRLNGKYLYQFVAPSNKNEKLLFYINAEQFDAKLEIEEISVKNAKVQIIAAQGNAIVLSGIRKGTTIGLDIKIPFDCYCKIEVEHYEAKK